MGTCNCIALQIGHPRLEKIKSLNIWKMHSIRGLNTEIWNSFVCMIRLQILLLVSEVLIMVISKLACYSEEKNTETTLKWICDEHESYTFMICFQCWMHLLHFNQELIAMTYISTDVLFHPQLPIWWTWQHLGPCILSIWNELIRGWHTFW